ncbi:DUF1573 domain-containing protein [bacterium]|nr:DUF1573 domain-containing protein [candidate division CSSED10-310 bacterium]
MTAWMTLFFILVASPTPGLISPPVESETILSINKEMTDGMIALDHTRFDFGKIYHQDSLSHDFLIKNTGNSTIHITDIKTDCGCTAAVVDSSAINPGETLAIHVNLKPDIQEGQIEKKVSVYTDAAKPDDIFELTVTAEKQTLIKIYPSHVYFKNVHFGEGGEETVHIKTAEDHNIHIMNAEVIEGDALEFTLTPVFETENIGNETEDSGLKDDLKTINEWKLVMHLPKETPAGRFFSKVKLSTNSPLQPEVVFPVYGVVRSQVSARPTQAYFGTLSPGEVKNLDIKISKTGDPTLKILSITSTVDAITWEQETVEDGAVYNLKLTLTVPNDHAGRISGTIDITTSDPTQPEISIPVFGYVPVVERVTPIPELKKRTD